MDNLLGDYLRARRGLRREELALLAGISSDYYVRLEQGRDQNPSAQVLDALARVLGLDDDATNHLHSLTAPAPRHRRRPRAGRAAELIGTWPATPAYVQDRVTNVLAANAAATALSPHYVAGHNLLREVFLDPPSRTSASTGTRRRPTAWAACAPHSAATWATPPPPS